MKLLSPVFSQHEDIPVRYTCDGEDIHPPLYIEEVPTGAKSLALVVDDPDAPLGLWVHWVVWNIAPDTVMIEEGNVPAGAHEGPNSSGKQMYHGPCPSSGEHRYFFRLYALDVVLELDVLQTGKEELKEAMHGHILAVTELVGRYRR